VEVWRVSGHILNLKLWLAGAVVLASSGAPAAMGQAVAASPPQTVEDALHEMSDAAGVIFAGQVMRVHPVAGPGGTGGVVEVTFQVDQAVKDCAAGGTYVLREWAGLWSGGDARYRVGQRLLMLLRTPSAAGMSSPVGGMDGAIPITGVVTAIATNQTEVGATSVAPNAPAAAAMVDLRWVATRMLRTAPYMPTTSGTIVSASTVPAGGSAGSGPGTSGTSTNGAGTSSSVPAAGASVDTVIGMLSSWEAERVAQ